MPLLPLFEPALAFAFGLGPVFELAGGVFWAGRSPRAGDCRTGLGFVAAPARLEEELRVVAGFLLTRGLDWPRLDVWPSARPFAPAVADLPRLVVDDVVGLFTWPGAGPPRARA